MPTGPSQHLILPDPKLEGRANLVSVTSEQGPFAGATVPGSTNSGSLYPMQGGIVDADVEAVDYQLVESGGTDVAEFVYKQQDESVYSGKDDPRRIWKFTTPSNLSADSNTFVYSRVFRRLVCFTENGSFNVDIRYRNVGTDVDYTSWTFVSDLVVKNKLETFDHELAALELQDGALLLFVRTDNVNGVLGDIDVYRSDDGGINWVMHSEKIITRFTGGGNGSGGTPWGGSGGQVAAGKWRVRRSGDYIRLVQVILHDDGGGNEGRLSTLLSTDRGVTWLHVGGTFTTNDVGTHGGNDDQYPFDFVSTDNKGGFMLTAKDRLSPNDSVGWRASGNAQWETSGAGNQVEVDEVRSIALVNDGSFITMLLFTTAGVFDVDDNATMRRHTIGTGDPGDATAWETVNFIYRTTGWRHVPIRVEMLVTGEGTALNFAVADQQASYAEESLQVVGFMGDVWTRRSLGESGPGRPLVVDPATDQGILYDLFWTAWSGRPAPAGNSQVSTDTLWTESLALTPTISSTQERLDLSVNATGEKVVYQIDYNARLNSAGLAGPAYQTNGSVWGWVAKLDSSDGDDTPATGRFMHVRVVSSQSAAAGASNRIDVSVRMGPAAVSIFDENFANYVGAITTDQLDNVEHEYRLFLFDDGPVSGYLTVINLHTGAVLTSGLFELQENNIGSPANFVEFGIDARPAGEGTEGIEWRELWTMWGKGSRENDPQNPDDLIGASCKAVPQFVERGLEVSWAGASGVPGDTFEGPIGHAYPVENVFHASPRICHRSNALVAHAIIFDADPVNGFGRFFHDAAAVFGIEDGSVIIDYDDNVGFASPVGGITLTPKPFAALSVGNVRGDTIFLNTAEPQPGEAVGMILQWTSGSLFGQRMLCTLHQDAGAGSYLTFEGEDLAVVNPGDGFDLYTTASSGSYPGGAVDGQRYMRIRMLDTNTPTGRHQLCTLVVGHKLAFTVPLDWAHSDNEQPNITTYSSRSAIDWSYLEGPPQRTWIGRVVGDANRWREKFRDFMRSFVGYEKRAMALVLDDEKESYEPLLVKLRSGSQEDNAAWYKDANGVWRTAGDLSVRFTQEV